MDRNDNRWWYDRGYSLGVTETQRDAVLPRLLGAWVLFAFAAWEPVVAGAYLFLYSVWTLSDYRDRKAEAEHKRDVHTPGDRFEWE